VVGPGACSRRRRSRRPPRSSWSRRSPERLTCAPGEGPGPASTSPLEPPRRAAIARAMVRFSFCGHELVALPQGALYWPARRALLVADLHLEKASWFAGHGQMLRLRFARRPWPTSRRSPPPPTRRKSGAWATASTMSAAASGCRRRRARCWPPHPHHRWTWITGNHDPVVPAMVGGSAMPEALVDGIVLRHEADRHDPRPKCRATSTPSCASTAAAAWCRAAASSPAPPS
jgi:hypothetical protein